MSTTATASKTGKPGWDKRAWRLAAILCGVVGLLEVAQWDTALRHWVQPNLAGNLAFVSLVLALYVFPPILSGIARRRTLLWAYLPIVGFFAFAIVFSLLPQQYDSSDSSDPTTMEVTAVVSLLVLSPLISAGPVCLFRLIRRRAMARRQETATAMETAMRVQREGVWPPAAIIGQESEPEETK